MNPLVSLTTVDGIAVISIQNPPVNALSPGVPEGIEEAIQNVKRDPAIRAAVLIGSGRTFVAGADIKEFQKITSSQGSKFQLYPLLLAIEDCPKPVVMAIHGTALGGGLELAMAGHYRVASPGAQVGQPECKLGLIPGAAGTQRLPRLAGVAKAAEMCAFGEMVPAQDALAAGIIDKIVEGDLLQGAIAFAREALGSAPPKTRERNHKLAGEHTAVFAALREQCRKTRRNLIAPLAAIDAVEIATTDPFEEGCRREAEIFQKCLFSDQSKGLIHAFFGERAVSKVPDIPKDTPVYPIRTAAIVGAGTMGGGIAMAFANAGIPVQMKETSQEALDRGISTIRKNYENSVKRGRFPQAVMDERMARITPSSDGRDSITRILLSKPSSNRSN